MEALTLLRPVWLWGLLAVPLWILLWRWRSHRADPWRAVCDAELLKAQQISSASAMGLRLLWLLSVYVLTIIALAGPSLGREAQPLNQNSDALIVALDLSEVMRAGDLKPDRLSRARYKLTALLRQRKAGQTALIAYAGEAFTVAPLTDDLSTLDNLLQALDPSVMPIAGQRPERAIRMAQQMLDDAGLARARMLLLASATTRDAEHAAAEAQRRGLTVSVLGVGTDHGAPVPVGGGGFLLDSSGGILLPKLDDDALRELADAGGGVYQPISDDESDLRALGVLDPTRAEIGDEVAADQGMTRPREDGPWLLLLLLPLVAMAARRGVLWTLIVAAPLLSIAPESRASVWDDLWQRADQQAWHALQADDPARARELAEDPALRGSAAYRAQDFNAAAEDFANGADGESAYNRGTALAKAQRYEEALSALDEALRRDPRMPTQANRDAVAQWLEQKQQEKPEQPKSGEGGGRTVESPQTGSLKTANPANPGVARRRAAERRPNAGESGEQSQAQDAEGSEAAVVGSSSRLHRRKQRFRTGFPTGNAAGTDAQAPEQDSAQGERGRRRLSCRADQRGGEASRRCSSCCAVCPMIRWFAAAQVHPRIPASTEGNQR